MPRRTRSELSTVRTILMGCLFAFGLLLAAGCGASSGEGDSVDEAAATDTEDSAISQPGVALTDEESAVICVAFVEEYESLLAAPLHLRGSAFRTAADRLQVLQPASGGAAARLSEDMAQAAQAVEQFAMSVAGAESSLGFAPVNYMYTGNGLFVDDGDPSSLTSLDISTGEMQAMVGAADSVLATVNALCLDAGSTPSTDDTEAQPAQESTPTSFQGSASSVTLASEPSIAAGDHEFSVAAAGFVPAIPLGGGLGMVPVDGFGADDVILFVEFELLSGDAASFEGLTVVVSYGEGFESSPVILVTGGQSVILEDTTSIASDAQYQFDSRTTHAWAYPVTGTANDLHLVFPSGEVIDLSPLLLARSAPEESQNGTTTTADPGSTLETTEGFTSIVAEGAGFAIDVPESWTVIPLTERGLLEAEDELGPYGRMVTEALRGYAVPFGGFLAAVDHRPGDLVETGWITYGAILRYNWLAADPESAAEDARSIHDEQQDLQIDIEPFEMAAGDGVKMTFTLVWGTVSEHIIDYRIAGNNRDTWSIRFRTDRPDYYEDLTDTIARTFDLLN